LCGQVIGVLPGESEAIRIERDDVGRVIHERLGAHVQRSYGYDEQDRMSAQEVRNAAGSVFATHYKWDTMGNLLSRQDSVQGTNTYRYDALGQVLEQVDPRGRITRYLPDAAGDRFLTHIYERSLGNPNDSDGWTRKGYYGDTHYKYDRAGRLLERTGRDEALSLRWDVNHRLKSSTRNGEATHYGYDPFGRRVFKRGATHTIWFFWEGDALLGEARLANGEMPERRAGRFQIEGFTKARQRREAQARLHAQMREYVYYPGTFVPLALLERRQNATWVGHYHVDPNGSAIRITAQDGDAVWAAEYDALGGAAVKLESEVQNALRLQGQFFDEETGLHYNRYRYFDPSSGSFISQDPIGLVGGINPYRFAPNTLGWIDPLGLACGDAVRDLPSLKGKSVGKIEEILKDAGFVRTNPANPRNQRWVYKDRNIDKSEVQVHAYGNTNTGPYKAGNNAHAHKSVGKHGEPGTIELADDGVTVVSQHSDAAHIGIRNPSDFPAVSGRNHGD
jgi:RHS repeat-associated protein